MTRTGFAKSIVRRSTRANNHTRAESILDIRRTRFPNRPDAFDRRFPS